MKCEMAIYGAMWWETGAVYKISILVYGSDSKEQRTSAG